MKMIGELKSYGYSEQQRWSVNLTERISKEYNTKVIIDINYCTVYIGYNMTVSFTVPRHEYLSEEDMFEYLKLKIDNCIIEAALKSL